MKNVSYFLRAGALAAISALCWATAAQAQSLPRQQPVEQSAPAAASIQAVAPGSPEAQAAALQARTQERAHLHQQRQDIDAALRRGESECYQRFAVEDCLKRERRSARQATAPLVQREAALDEAERRGRAALRLSDIAERQQMQPLPGPVKPARVRDLDASTDVLQQERAYEAQERAQRLQQRQQRHAAEMSEQIPQRAAAAEKARQRLEDKRQAAEGRRARAMEAQQQRAASGRQAPAALDPLP